MKRNWDTVRQLLRSLERPETHSFKGDRIDGPITYHLKIMFESGLITGATLPGNDFEASGLTQKGRDLLAAMGGDATWENIKAMAEDNDIELTEESIDLFAGKIKPSRPGPP